MGALWAWPPRQHSEGGGPGELASQNGTGELESRSSAWRPRSEEVEDCWAQVHRKPVEGFEHVVQVGTGQSSKVSRSSPYCIALTLYF